MGCSKVPQESVDDDGKEASLRATMKRKDESQKNASEQCRAKDAAIEKASEADEEAKMVRGGHEKDKEGEAKTEKHDAIEDEKDSKRDENRVWPLKEKIRTA